ncbi:MAG TPA: MoaD/ThiS family protein [Gemmatimonadota bacterium]|nr:MoaD/ThiS family protein [Gemmatimonadota bacterium]
MTPPGTFNVRLFGPAREAAGAPVLAVELDAPASASEVIAALGRACPALMPLLPSSRVAVNRAYVEAETAVEPGDEVAILPPVGGG